MDRRLSGGLSVIVQPVIHDYLTQIFCKHYNMEPKVAAQAGLKFLDLLELYDMQLIRGDWVVPEAPEPLRRLTGWEKIIVDLQDIEESGREPWLSKEIQ